MDFKLALQIYKETDNLTGIKKCIWSYFFWSLLSQLVISTLRSDLRFESWNLLDANFDKETRSRCSIHGSKAKSIWRDPTGSNLSIQTKRFRQSETKSSLRFSSWINNVFQYTSNIRYSYKTLTFFKAFSNGKMNLLFFCVALIFAEKYQFHPHLVGYGQRFPRLDDMLNSVSFLTLFSYHFFPASFCLHGRWRQILQKWHSTYSNFNQRATAFVFWIKNLAELGLLYLFSDQIYDQWTVKSYQ